MKYLLLPLLFVFLSVSADAQNNPRDPITVYPNPVTDFIALTDNSDPSVAYMMVYNLVGKKVKEFEYTRGERYSVADLPKGMYLIQIQNRQGSTLTTLKLEKR